MRSLILLVALTATGAQEISRKYVATLPEDNSPGLFAALGSDNAQASIGPFADR
jgi:hypothetical protein